MLDLVGAVRFILSVGLLLACSVAIARRLGATWAERYWIALAAAVTQIATICVALSPARVLTPAAFLFAQLFLAMLLGWTIGFRAKGRLTWPDLKPVAATPARQLLLLYVALLIVLALGVAIVLPINTFDDRMYRASRAAYWLQHRSLLPWATHNARQTASRSAASCA